MLREPSAPKISKSIISGNPYDFVSIDVKIGRFQASNPDEISPIDSCIETITDLLKNLKEQDAIEIKLADKILSMDGNRAFDFLYKINFSPESIEDLSLLAQCSDSNPHVFFAIPDGPEPFLSIRAFCIFNKNTNFGRLLFKNKVSNSIDEEYIELTSYTKAWECLLKELINIKIKKAIGYYEKSLNDESPIIVLAQDKNRIIAPTELKTHDNFIKNLIDYFIKNKLVKPESIECVLKNKALTNKDLNLIGWCLAEAIDDRWFNSKRTMSGNPNFSSFDEKLEKIKKDFIAVSINPYLPHSGHT